MVVPAPTVLDGNRLTDGRGSGVNIAVGVAVVGNLILGSLNGGGSSTIILILEIEGAGAEDEFLNTIIVNCGKNCMRKDEILKLGETGGDGGVVIISISGEDIIK